VNRKRNATAELFTLGGCTPVVIQVLLGHANLDTTARYAQVASRLAEQRSVCDVVGVTLEQYACSRPNSADTSAPWLE
jgi:hypothetical protein